MRKKGFKMRVKNATRKGAYLVFEHFKLLLRAIFALLWRLE